MTVYYAIDSVRNLDIGQEGRLVFIPHGICWEKKSSERWLTDVRPKQLEVTTVHGSKLITLGLKKLGL